MSVYVYVSPKIADHLDRLARDVAYTEGHASVMRAAADVIRRSASPAAREAVARLLCEAEDSGTYSEGEGTCTWHFKLADRLLAAFTITEKGDES